MALRWIAAVLAGLLAVLVGLAVALVVALALIDWDIFHDEFEAFASEFLGREVRLGELELGLGWTTDVYLRDLRIANTEWARQDQLFRLGEGQVTLRVLPLLWGDLHITRIRLHEPDLALQRDAEGRVNWHFAALAERAGDLAKPEDRGEFPIIERFAIEGGRLSYLDPGRDLDLQGSIATGQGQAEETDPLELTLEGMLEGRPLSLDLTAGSVLRLRETESPYPLSLDVRFGETTAQAQGTTLDLVQLEAVQLDLKIEGPTLADVFPLLNMPLPDTPPYSLAGALTYRDGIWILREFSGTIGDSDVTGELQLDTTPDKPLLKARIVSKKLDFDDLAGLVGATPDPTETANPEQIAAAERPGLFPDIPINADRVHAMNMDVTFEGEQVITPVLPIDRLSFHVRVHDGRAEASPLSISIAGGKIVGVVAFNARDTPPSADADLDFENLDLQPFFKDTEFVQQMGGRFTGHTYLLGVGQSLAAILGTARGNASIAMQDGSVSGLLVEAAGLDVTESLGLLIGEDARVAIRCGRLDLKVEDGVADIQRLLLDTTDSLLVGKGIADLGKESFELQIEARAKDFSLIDISAPVRIWGTYPELEYAIGGIDPLPFFEMGTQKDLNCASLVGDVMQHRHKSPGGPAASSGRQSKADR